MLRYLSALDLNLDISHHIKFIRKLIYKCKLSDKCFLTDEAHSTQIGKSWFVIA